jgi:FkbM family methyltransferase
MRRALPERHSPARGRLVSRRRVNVFRGALPRDIRDEVWKLRRLGVAKYARYRRLEREQRRNGIPEAGVPFDIGGLVPIIPHQSTVPGLRSHWVESGQGIRELRAFREVAQDARLLVDVGAGAGIFSAAFCALTGGRVIAFEPSPQMQERLAGVIRVNPTFDIQPTQAALGSVEGQQQVVASDDGQFRGVEASEPARMRVLTLDGVARERGLTPDLVKIDVEGMELEVLRGAQETLRGSVQAVILEVHAPMLPAGQSVEDIQKLSAALGFEVLTLEFKLIDDLAHYVAHEREISPGVVNVVLRRIRDLHVAA